MNNFFNNIIGWTKKPTSPRFVYPTAAKFCCCLPYKARRGCDRLFTYVSTQAREEKRLFCYYIVTTLLLLKTVLAQNIQVTFFLYLQNVLAAGGEELLTDDDEEEEIHSSNSMKKCSRETAKLLPSDKKRMDSFEAELDDNTAV